MSNPGYSARALPLKPGYRAEGIRYSLLRLRPNETTLAAENRCDEEGIRREAEEHMLLRHKTVLPLDIGDHRGVIHCLKFIRLRPLSQKPTELTTWCHSPKNCRASVSADRLDSAPDETSSSAR